VENVQILNLCTLSPREPARLAEKKIALSSIDSHIQVTYLTYLFPILTQCLLKLPSLLEFSPDCLFTFKMFVLFNLQIFAPASLRTPKLKKSTLMTPLVSTHYWIAITSRWFWNNDHSKNIFKNKMLNSKPLTSLQSLTCIHFLYAELSS